MSGDPQLNSLLKWSIEAQAGSGGDARASEPARAPAPEALAALFGGKSDAELMVESMAAARSTELPLSERLIAWDNLEQLIESIDNANNLGPLELWTPLVEQLGDAEPQVALMAAWCVGTAVQNNPQSQERALVCGVVKPLVALSRSADEKLRRKAAYALSSEVRNFQPGLDAVLKELGDGEAVDATDMESIDKLVAKFREGKI